MIFTFSQKKQPRNIPYPNNTLPFTKEKDINKKQDYTMFSKMSEIMVHNNTKCTSEIYNINSVVL